MAALLVAGAGHTQQLVPTPAPTAAQLSDAEFRDRCLAIEHLSDWSAGRQPEVSALARSATTAQVEALLADLDGRVRAVAIVLLFEQLGYRAVPLVEPLLDDTAATAPSRRLLVGAMSGEPQFKEHPQTVGDIASAVLARHIPTSMRINYAGDGNTVDARVLRRAYVDYLESRHGREWSWPRIASLAYRLHRAIRPIRPEALAAMQRLRAELDSAPEPARSWYLLGLGCDDSFGEEQVVGVQDRVAALRALPVVELLKFLAAEGPGDAWPPNVDPQRFWPDPDVTAAKDGAYPWQAVARFAIEHGAEWLPPDRLDDWIALAELHPAAAADGRMIGVGQWSLPISGWWQTAARLDPEHAAKWIDRGALVLGAKSNARECGLLMITASRQLGAAGRHRAVDWFFSGVADQPFYGDLQDAAERALLAAILADERLDGLGPMAMQTLALACNAQRGDGPEPFPGNEPRHLSHPLGIYRYQKDPEAAAAQCPTESKALERTLTDWRRRMRAFAAEQLR